MFARLLAGTVLALLICGCNPSGMGPQGEVTGKVTYQGKPLPGGQVTFLTSKGLMFTGVIDPEGNYKVKAAVGEAKIGVDNSMLKKSDDSPKVDIRHPPGVKPPPGVQVEEDRSGTGAVSGTYVPLPAKFQSPEESGLKFNVKTGTQTHDIDLSANP